MKIKKILSIFASLALVLSLLAGCKFTIKPSNTSVEGLATYKSHSDIQKLITDAMKKNNQIPGFFESLVGAIRGGMQNDMAKNVEDAAMGEAPASGNDNGALDDYSKTNLQVEGVDEADIVKTDGRYLYIIANGRLIIVDAINPADMKIVSEIVYIYIDQPEKNINTPVEMFLDEENDKLTVVSYSYDDRLALIADDMESGAAIKGDIAFEPGFARGGWYWWGMQNVLVQVFDLTDIANPELEREFTQEGSYLSSRRINEHIYIVTNKYVYYFSDIPNKDYMIPATKDTSSDGEWEMVAPDSIYVVEQSDFSSFVVLSSIDTSDPESEPDIKAVLGSGHNMYASPSNIYIANTQYRYEQTQGTDVAEGNAADKDEAVTSVEKPAIDSVVDDVFRIFQPPVYTVFTDIFRFGISDGIITPKGSGKVPGYILNQFAMDENNGYFRIATTTGDTWREDEFTSMNNLYILDADLEITGKVEGLATRETIRSVRFMGKMAYMVTFRTTDPLFVLDLSDPKNPQVKGELKIPGYSQYLHPISDTILVGFGREAIEEGDRAIELGIKLSVFDVSDVSNPKEISTMIIGDQGTYSEVLYNHKSLLYSKEKNILAFPITIYENTSSNNNERLYWNYLPTFAGYIITGLTEDYKLFEKGRISHYKVELPEDITDEKEIWAAYERFYSMEYLYRVNRGMFIGNTLFTISNAYVKANSLDDFSDIGTVDLPGFKEINSYYFDGYYREYPDEGDQGKPDGDGGQVDPGSSDGNYDGQDTLTFVGVVEEILDGGIRVKVADDFTDIGFDIATVWYAPEAKITEKPEVGQTVKVEILPEIRESYPVQVTAIYLSVAG